MNAMQRLELRELLDKAKASAEARAAAAAARAACSKLDFEQIAAKAYAARRAATQRHSPADVPTEDGDEPEKFYAALADRVYRQRRAACRRAAVENDS